MNAFLSRSNARLGILAVTTVALSVAVVPVAVGANPTIAGVTATSSVAKTTVVYPHLVEVLTKVTYKTGLSTGQPATGQTATLQRRFAGGSQWSDVKSVKPKAINSKGTVEFFTTPTRATGYRVVLAASSTEYSAKSSPTANVHVAPKVGVSIAKELPQLTSVKVAGTVAPAVGGSYRVQQLRSGKWATLSKATVHGGRFSTTATFKHLGKVKLRLFRQSDDRHAKSASTTVAATVVHRQLKEGASGPDVLALQRRLRSLHYDIGDVNGDFGFDMFHAVTAFQKIQGLEDDGVVGPKFWAALAHPKTIGLRHPIKGETAVEVNLTKQVVLIAKNGKVWRIIDSSTAGGYEYTDSEGSQERATTPEGHFSIQYKIDHQVKSKLGYLWRPAFFNDSGYAIHGEGDVPAYPASHGCVRITIPAMNRYYNTFYVGESVWIYGNPPYVS